MRFVYMLLISIIAGAAIASPGGDGRNPVRSADSAPANRPRPANPDASRFVGISRFDSWTREPANEGEVLISPRIDAGIEWDQLIVSWNADAPAGTGIEILVRAVSAEHSTKLYSFGRWARDSATPAFSPTNVPVASSTAGTANQASLGTEVGQTAHIRESIAHQKDVDGTVDTDTLILTRPARSVELRILLTTAGGTAPNLRFLGLSFLDSRVRPSPELNPAKRPAWGKTLDVPERAQGSYPHGAVICSATCTSMSMAYWSRATRRPELDGDVPAVVEGVYDRGWGGTGNWPFNTAYAGSFPGMRAYVTRLASISELEEWIEAGIPVVCSVSYNLLRARPRSGDDGHLVVCVGFTPNGDVVLNDPALNPKRGLHVRTPYPRSQFAAGWAHSNNTVYLIYPDGHRIPRARGHHWYDSAHR